MSILGDAMALERIGGVSFVQWHISDGSSAGEGHTLNWRLLRLEDRHLDSDGKDGFTATDPDRETHRMGGGRVQERS